MRSKKATLLILSLLMSTFGFSSAEKHLRLNSPRSEKVDQNQLEDQEARACKRLNQEMLKLEKELEELDNNLKSGAIELEEAIKSIKKIDNKTISSIRILDSIDCDLIFDDFDKTLAIFHQIQSVKAEISQDLARKKQAEG